MKLGSLRSFKVPLLFICLTSKMCCYEDFFFNKVLLSKGLFHVSYNFFKIIHVSLSLTIEDPSPPLPLLKIIIIRVYLL